MKTPRQAGQNVSGVIQSFENSTQSSTGGLRPPPGSVRSVTPTGRSASPPLMTLSSPPRSPRMSSRAASRADQLRSAQNMIETMESRINGTLPDVSFKVEHSSWEAELARSAGGRARKLPYSELVLVNGSAEGDASSGTNFMKQQQQVSKSIPEEKPSHPDATSMRGQIARFNKGPIVNEAPDVAGKGERSMVRSASESASSGVPPHRNAASAQQQKASQLQSAKSRHSSSSSSFDASDQDTEVDEQFRSLRAEHAYDMSSPVSSHGDAGGHNARHSMTAVPSRSFSEDDLMLLSTERGVDASSLMTPQERAKRFFPSSKVSEDELEFDQFSDGEREPESPPPATTPLEVTDTSLEEQSDYTSNTRAESRPALKTKLNPVQRDQSTLLRGTKEAPAPAGVHAHKLLHPLKAPKFRGHGEESSMSSASGNSDRSNGRPDDKVKRLQWDTEQQTQVDEQALQRDEEARKVRAAAERLLQRRKQSELQKSKQPVETVAESATPEKRKKKEPEAGRLLPSRPSPEPFSSSTNREAPISSNALVKIASTGPPKPSSLKRSVSEVGEIKETSHSGKPPAFARSGSASNIGQSYKGSKDSFDQALQPVNPSALPDAGAKLRNVIRNSISVSGVAAAFYRGGYLPIGGMSADDSTAHLNAYLREVRREAEAGVPGRWLTAVLGSETGDLDSIFSSIAYAYLLYSTIKTDQQCFVPVINMRREELPLHMEACWLLEVTGIDVKSLLFIDEISLSYYHRFGSLRLVMVDHSRLAPQQEGLQEAVVEIVDHVPAGEQLKKSEQIYPWVLARELEQVGSCATLIAERFASEAPLLLGGQGIARILLAPILLDTGNLDKTAGQSTSRDETMVTLLLRGAGSYGRNGFYKLLRKKKFDTSVLNTRDLLRKDFNLWTFGPVKSEKHGYRGEKILAGMSSVGMTLGELLSREPGVIEEIVRFREWRRLRLLIIITGYYDRTSIFRRELFIAPEHPELADDLADYFNVSSDDGLKLEPLYVNGLPREMRAYSQGNATASRKKIQPMLFEFFCT